ncbi:YhcG family protein [Myroides sp. N17-2]|uniref:PDDEXK nuclease domain-containing protein n=1 Tax=Myroides sp. N17-2 TaxID=2030799 RepID=UPI000EFAA1BA|nr:PDDEXK nuclease domain-containing protein [Myroides sp. N17-2]
MDIQQQEHYSSFLIEVKERIRSAQYEAMKAVNKEMISLYWDIGKQITSKQEQLGWGKSVVETLSKDLQEEFPGIRGFGVSNLWSMAQFFTEYNKSVILQPSVGEISWTKHLVIMTKCKNEQERQFYILSTKRYGWSKNLLINKIESKNYEKYLTGQANFDKTLPDNIKNQAILAIKDDYVFNFLNLTDEHSEADLEQALIKDIRSFLIEFGADYTFVGNQYKIEIEGEEFFIDVLLYHRKLQALIAVELKIGKFLPEYKGKMEFYLNVLNDTIKLPHENPSIGIIICKSKKGSISKVVFMHKV